MFTSVYILSESNFLYVSTYFANNADSDSDYMCLHVLRDCSSPCSCFGYLTDDTAAQPAHQRPPLSEELSHSLGPDPAQRFPPGAHFISKRGEKDIMDGFMSGGHIS